MQSNRNTSKVDDVASHFPGEELSAEHYDPACIDIIVNPQSTYAGLLTTDVSSNLALRVQKERLLFIYRTLQEISRLLHDPDDDHENDDADELAMLVYINYRLVLYYLALSPKESEGILQLLKKRKKIYDYLFVLKSRIAEMQKADLCNKVPFSDHLEQLKQTLNKVDQESKGEKSSLPVGTVPELEEKSEGAIASVADSFAVAPEALEYIKTQAELNRFISSCKSPDAQRSFQSVGDWIDNACKKMGGPDQLAKKPAMLARLLDYMRRTIDVLEKTTAEKIQKYIDDAKNDKATNTILNVIGGLMIAAGIALGLWSGLIFAGSLGSGTLAAGALATGSVACLAIGLTFFKRVKAKACHQEMLAAGEAYASTHQASL